MCGGSNYRVLLSHGIEPDFLTLVERADDVYDTYKAIYEEFGQTKTSWSFHRLVMISWLIYL